MAIRETVKMPPVVLHHRRQVRTFALVWTGLTLLIGAIAFFTIYAATGLVSASSVPRVSPVSITVNDQNAAPVNPGNTDHSTNQGAPVSGDNLAAVAAQGTATSAVPPTNTPKGAAAPAVSGQATQAASGGAAQAGTPTLSAVSDADFDLGIAVQENADKNVFSIWTKQASQELKLNWVKLQIVWRAIEKDKGNIDFGGLDVELPLLNASNTKVLLSITKAPDWARDKGAKIKPDVYDGPPTDPNEFATFLTALLKRYPGMIHAVEVWNEVNLDREWSTAPQSLDPSRYVKLLQIAHDAIKAVDPNVVVITAALSPTGASAGQAYQDDFVYFKRLLDAGMLKYADCVGAHANGYNVPPTQDRTNLVNRPKAVFRGPFDNINHSWYFKETLEGYHKMIAAAGSTTKICLTEFGWASLEGLQGKPRAGFEFAGDNSLQDQANYIDAAI
ncbi:MAG TPA: hypothetical protein VMT24_00820, partial [Aggregatilineaceae bacterium]|nr:hypothetical protein [Aggregatilineaceae bacterium]